MSVTEDTTINRILDIVDLIGARVRLVQLSKSLHVGSSPFSGQEPNASLLVSRDLQLFHCKATGLSGGLAQWIQFFEAYAGSTTPTKNERRVS